MVPVAPSAVTAASAETITTSRLVTTWEDPQLSKTLRLAKSKIQMPRNPSDRPPNNLLLVGGCTLRFVIIGPF